MNQMQKTAYWTVGCISTGVVLALIAIMVLHFVIGWPWPIAKAGLGFLGLTGFAGFAPFIFKKDPGKITCDERDRLINNKAALLGFLAAFLITGLVCMIPFFVLGPQATVSITCLPTIFMAAGLASFFVHSIAILLQYGGRNKNE